MCGRACARARALAHAHACARTHARARTCAHTCALALARAPDGGPTPEGPLRARDAIRAAVENHYRDLDFDVLRAREADAADARARRERVRTALLSVGFSPVAHRSQPRLGVRAWSLATHPKSARRSDVPDRRP